MKFQRLLEMVEDEPVFESSLLLAGEIDPADLRRQLTRWTQKGNLVQLQRGLYCLAAPYRKVVPHPFLVANRLRRGSYVSLQSALGFHGLIPEYVPAVTSVTTGRPGQTATPVGRFEFRHVAQRLFVGYERLELGGGQQAFVASAEKALLDLVHLRAGGDGRRFLDGLRLQNLDRLKLPRLRELASGWRRPKMTRAADRIERLTQAEAGSYESL